MPDRDTARERAISSWAWALGLMVWLGACSRGPEGRSEAARGAPVAGCFAGGAIAEAELSRQAERLQPELRERFAIVDKRLLGQGRGAAGAPSIRRSTGRSWSPISGSPWRD